MRNALFNFSIRKREKDCNSSSIPSLSEGTSHTRQKIEGKRSNRFSILGEKGSYYLDIKNKAVEVSERKRKKKRGKGSLVLPRGRKKGVY